ncbi:trypsin-like peptidase domain-containing protein [candidate division KSB1 bacterium]|nr:trypsin-like peptidase domain-containing protein [candidate division KSB1 bacterium]
MNTRFISFRFAAMFVFLFQVAYFNPTYLIGDEKTSSPTAQSATDILPTSHVLNEIAHTVIPTVVSIYSTVVVQTKDLWNERFDSEEMRDFFGDHFRNLPVPSEFRQRGAGSGIIIAPNGYILTNVHVVENAEDIEVTLSDKRTMKADVVGIDPLTEIAVIKIDVMDLPIAVLGNSDSCKIGEWVMAVGNPLELNSTVTIGIISAKGRDINIIRDTYGLENFIQTDAAINPGNSGGPLINLQGEVIGVNTAIATENGFNQGYGFAIPINLAKDIMTDLIEKGRVVRGYLGISMQDITEIKARALHLKKPMGVFVDHVIIDGPAYKAGLKAKDVILKLDKFAVNRANAVQSIIAAKNPGESVSLAVLRDGKIQKLEIVLGERQYAIMVPPASRKKGKYDYLGMVVDTLTNQIINDLSLSGQAGVLITDVERYGPAYEANIQANDVLFEIGDETISRIGQFYQTIAKLPPGEVVILKIRREDTTFHAFVQVPE